MKRLFITPILLLLAAFYGTIAAQGRQEELLGLPGDNLNLYAVMTLFQESKTLEGFERSLNDENTGINNLDLNGDNVVDYITVSDYVDGNVHNIVLRVAVSPQENQDVAVLTVEKMQDGSVQIQLIGDESLYGKNYIIEPVNNNPSAETPNPGYTNNYYQGTVIQTSPYYVNDWPLINFLFLPDYIAWHSPWYWGYESAWWNPWHPWSWDYYYGYHYNWYPQYYANFRMGNHFHYSRYNDFYYHGVRSYSRYVSDGIRGGRYRSTYGHPEQRREGESRFARVQSERNFRSRQTGTTINRTRISSSQEGRNRISSGFNQRGNSGTYNNSAPSRNNRTSVRRENTLNNYNNSVSRPRSDNQFLNRNSSTVRRSATVPNTNSRNFSSGNTGNSRNTQRSYSVQRGTSGTSFSRGNSSSLKSAQGWSGRSSRSDVSSSSRRFSASAPRVSSGSSGRQSIGSGRSSGSYGSGRSSGSFNSGRSSGSISSGRSSGSFNSGRSSGSYGGSRSSGSIGSSRSSGSYGGGRSSGSNGGGGSSRSSGSGGSSRR